MTYTPQSTKNELFSIALSSAFTMKVEFDEILLELTLC
jgi:hypothetical protein